MSSPTIVSVEDKAWDTLVLAAKVYDFYHTQEYHQLETRNTRDIALLFVCKLEDDFVALPLIKRTIPNTNYFDITSVYGYCGAISNLDSEEISSTLKENFQQQFLQFLKDENCVSAFSRLHPIVSNLSVFDSIGELVPLNKTVAIDTRLPLDEQRRQFRKSNKSEINQLRKKKGYVVVKATTDEQIEQFVAVYIENMQRVEASAYYMFDVSYFRTILNSKSYDATLLLCYQGEELAAGAIFTETSTIMQYHLAGTKNEYIRDTPMKLILDEARILATENNRDFLHLGGGVGGSDEDSLFRFKSGFSKHFFQFHIWKYVVNQEVYDELAAASDVKNSNFFPAYRAN